jgi:hypothetical protein
MVSYDVASKVTYCFVSCNITGVANFFLRRLKVSAPYANHQLLLLVIYAEWQSRKVNIQRIQNEDNLLRFEDRTGHTIFRTASGFFMDSEGQPTNIVDSRINPQAFRQLSVNLSQLNFALSVMEVFASSVQSFCSAGLSLYLDELEQATLAISNPSLSAPARVLKQRLELVNSSAYHCHLRVAAYEKRCQLQMGIVRCPLQECMTFTDCG